MSLVFFCFVVDLFSRDREEKKKRSVKGTEGKGKEENGGNTKGGRREQGKYGTWATETDGTINIWQVLKKKSRIRETKHL